MKKKYMLEGIDPDLWKDFKAACAYYKVSMRDRFIKHMQNTVIDFRLIMLGEDETKSKPKKGGKKR